MEPFSGRATNLLPNSAAGFGAPLGYSGPNPPAGHKAYKYMLTMYALDVKELGLAEDATYYVDFINAMKGHITATAALTAYYGH